MSNFTPRSLSNCPRTRMNGVLPDPPNDKLPTLTTGPCNLFARAMRRSYSALRARTPIPKIEDRGFIDGTTSDLPLHHHRQATVFPTLAAFYALPPSAPAEFLRHVGPVRSARLSWK